MKLKLACTVLLCVLLVGVSGCARFGAATTADTEQSPGLAGAIPLAPDFRISDIPVPAGFVFDREHSFVFQDSAMEVGKMQYSGKEAIGDVAQFYLDEMPRYNWTLLNVTEHNVIFLDFTKEGKACQVLLTPKARGTLIQATFYPKAMTAAPGY
jgi:hypothetical protein